MEIAGQRCVLSHIPWRVSFRRVRGDTVKGYVHGNYNSELAV